jgi:hypothetical protein
MVASYFNTNNIHFTDFESAWPQRGPIPVINKSNYREETPEGSNQIEA